MIGGLPPAGSMALGMGAPGGAAPQPLYGPQDQRSQYLAQALQQMQTAQPQGPVAAGSDLLAQALLQYGQGRGQMKPGQPMVSQAFQPGANPQAMDLSIDPTLQTGGLFFGG